MPSGTCITVLKSAKVMARGRWFVDPLWSLLSFPPGTWNYSQKGISYISRSWREDPNWSIQILQTNKACYKNGQAYCTILVSYIKGQRSIESQVEDSILCLAYENGVRSILVPVDLFLWIWGRSTKGACVCYSFIYLLLQINNRAEFTRPLLFRVR